jgi:hypothetical protein
MFSNSADVRFRPDCVAKVGGFFAARLDLSVDQFSVDQFVGFPLRACTALPTPTLHRGSWAMAAGGRGT